MIKLVLLLTKRCRSLRAIRFAWPPLMPVEIRRAFLRPDGGGVLVWSGGDAPLRRPEAVFWSRRGWNMLEDSEQRRSCVASMEAALSALVAGMFLCWPNLRRGAFTIPISSTFISWVYSHLGRPMEDSSLGKMLTDVEQLVQVHQQNSQGCQGFLGLRMSARLACGLPLPQEILWWPLEGVQWALVQVWQTGSGRRLQPFTHVLCEKRVPECQRCSCRSMCNAMLVTLGGDEDDGKRSALLCIFEQEILHLIGCIRF